MSTPSIPDRPSGTRTTGLVRDPDVAAQVVVDLTERGIDAARVVTRDLDPGQGALDARDTGEDDLAFTESAGKTMGAGFVIGALIGAVVGAIGVSLLFAPPWTSPLAAGITLAVAIGVGYIAGGLGFLQAGIANAGENGGEPSTATRPGSGQSDRGVASNSDAVGTAGGRVIEVTVDAASPDEAALAREIFSEHRIDIRD